MSKLTQAQRDALPKSKFADPANRKFPILDCSDFEDAWGLAGHADNPDAVRKRILRMGRGMHCKMTPAMTAHMKMSVGDGEVEEGETRARLDATAMANANGEFEIAAITAGEAIGHGWKFSTDVLQASLDLWDGVEVFVDHAQMGRSLRDLGGVLYDPQWSDSLDGIVGKLRPSGPSGALLSALGREMLSDADPLPRVGFSADVLFLADKEKNVREIVKVFSVDSVFDPARGGAFVRALNSVGAISAQEVSMAEQEVVTTPAPAVTPAPTAPAPVEAGGTVVARLSADLKAIQDMVGVQEERAKLAAEAEKASALRAVMCSYLLDTGLMASKLPKPSQDRVRAQFAGKVFEPSELEAAIEDARKLVAELTNGAGVAGITVAHGMFNSADQLQAAVDDLLLAPRDKGAEALKVARLSGIRELYHMMTGDYQFYGGYFPERARFQHTTATFTGLVKNAMNKAIVNHWQALGKAGYDWWTRIATVEHFQTLNGITWVIFGSVGSLPTVSEGAEYTELKLGDSPETSSFVKYGGYVGITLEAMDRDDTRKLRMAPKELANAALRNISSLVAALFTDNAAVGPTLADGGALFNNTAVTTSGGHKNLLTTALAAAEWEVVSAAVYNQPMLIANETGYYGTGKKMAINPRFCLVPRALGLTAAKILYPAMENAANITSENLQRGQPGDVVIVPEWTDATDWAAVVDPAIMPGVMIGERFGIMPEVFVAGDELSPAVFMNDESRIKVRHYVAVGVADFRPLHKTNAA